MSYSAQGGRITNGLYANLPSLAASQPGDQYICTDSIYSFRRGLTAWQTYAFGYPVTPPAVGDYAWENQVNMTVDSSKGGLNFGLPASQGGAKIGGMVTALPSVPYQLVVGFVPGVIDYLYEQIGVSFGWFLSSTNASQTGNFQAVRIGVIKWNGSYSWDGDTLAPIAITQQPAMYFLLEDNNTNRTLSYGCTPRGPWVVIKAVARTDYITPDQLILGMYGSGSNTYASSAWYFHVAAL